MFHEQALLQLAVKRLTRIIAGQAAAIELDLDEGSTRMLRALRQHARQLQARGALGGMSTNVSEAALEFAHFDSAACGLALADNIQYFLNLVSER
jgi:hypothetical protein